MPYSPVEIIATWESDLDATARSQWTQPQTSRVLITFFKVWSYKIQKSENIVTEHFMPSISLSFEIKLYVNPRTNDTLIKMKFGLGRTYPSESLGNVGLINFLPFSRIPQAPVMCLDAPVSIVQSISLFNKSTPDKCFVGPSPRWEKPKVLEIAHLKVRE